MQPKTQTRPANMANKNEADLVKWVQKRRRKKYEVRFPIGKSVHRPCKIPPPTKRAVEKVETALAMLCNQELPDWAEHMVTITLNKLHDTPPVLPKNATPEQHKVFRLLPTMKAMLSANLNELKNAHQVGDAKKAAYAYGAACNLIGHLEAMYDMTEIAEGLAVPERRKHGAEKTQKKFAKRRAEFAAKYQPDINRRVLKGGQSFENALTFTANQHKISRETLRNYVNNPRRRKSPKKV